MKTNDAQQRICNLFFALAGKELTGLSNAELARLLKTSESRMVSDTRNMEHAGIVERLHDGKWRLAPRVVQIAQAHKDGLEQVRLKLVEVEQRFGRLPARSAHT